MSAHRFLAKITSLRQRIDHFVCAKLNDDAVKVFLETSNLQQLEMQYPMHHVRSRKTTTQQKENGPTKEELDLDETIIITRKRKPKQATIQSLTTSIDKNQKQFEVWLKRGKLWQKKGDYAAAFSDFLRAYKLSDNPKIITAIEQLQDLQNKNGPNVNLISLLPKK